MTIIEFFDGEKFIDNIVSALCFGYDKIVYIGASEIMKEQVMSRVLNFVMERNPDAAVSFIHVKKGGLSEIIEKLTEIVTSEKDCVFEAAGGSDEALIALGVVSERFGIPIVKADYDKRTLVPVMAGGLFTHNADAFDGTVGKKKDVNKEKGKLLSIYEIIELGGGMICGYENNIFNISPALYRDVSVLWQAGRGDCSFWSSVCNALLPMQSKATGLKVKAPLTERLRSAVPFVEKLSELGFIKDFKCTENEAEFEYRDFTVKNIMSKTGNLLELITMFGLLSKNEIREVYRGCSIMWRRESGAYSVRNEIDVMFMKGARLFFVSCKSGRVEKEHLYELSSVAECYSGGSAAKILVAQHIGGSDANVRSIKERAASLDIKIVDNVWRLTAAQLADKIMEVSE